MGGTCSILFSSAGPDQEPGPSTGLAASTREVQMYSKDGMTAAGEGNSDPRGFAGSEGQCRSSIKAAQDAAPLGRRLPLPQSRLWLQEVGNQSQQSPGQTRETAGTWESAATSGEIGSGGTGGRGGSPSQLRVLWQGPLCPQPWRRGQVGVHCEPTLSHLISGDRSGRAEP